MKAVAAEVFGNAWTLSDEAWVYYAVDALLNGWDDPRARHAEERATLYLKEVDDLRRHDRRRRALNTFSDEDNDSHYDHHSSRRKRTHSRFGDDLGGISLVDVAAHFTARQQAAISAPWLAAAQADGDAFAQPAATGDGRDAGQEGQENP